uniref:Reverse transcriptase Ty1/copia-type domain-containing protein n=1 Tax=Solanum lycopersicum TaxID=4081 RepID=A0A3Q7G4W6_SOLLC
MKDLCPLNFFLGIEVNYFEGGIHLNQSKYGAEMLAKTEMTLANAVATPLSRKQGLREAVGSFVYASFYRMIVGSLQYLTLTRHDITHAVNLTSQFMQSPNVEHFQGVKMILRYIKGCMNTQTLIGEVVDKLGDQLQFPLSLRGDEIDDFKIIRNCVQQLKDNMCAKWYLILF